MTSGSGRPGVLLAAGGAAWEAEALPVLERAGVVVLKRCVDLHDLMGSATAGQAEVAVVSADMPGLDADAVMHLLRYDVRTVAVIDSLEQSVEQRERLGRLGVVRTTLGEHIGDLGEVVTEAVSEQVVTDPEPPDPAESTLPTRTDAGRVVAVWGPAGAPGRSTVAVGLAAERAASSPVVLVDADPYAGVIAQHLGVLDEVSGLLAAARLVNAGTLDAGSFAQCRRRVADAMDVLTGLPRADRWPEVRAGVMHAVVERSAAVGDVVVDTGFCLEDDYDRAGSGRNRMTLDSLAVADEVVVVGSAEPSGLARLARGLVDLRDAAPGVGVRVVVNRMRPTLGWSHADITGMVEGYVRPLGVHFLAEDRPAVDRAVVNGQALTESAESPLRQGIADLTAAVYGTPAPAPVRRRRAGRARLR